MTPTGLGTDDEADASTGAAPTAVASAPARKRPKPGERRVQILQALATMLERPAADRITTAALAAQIGVSEAALYRHFASKAQMFEGLIDFIEQSLFTLANQIIEREQDAAVQVQRLLSMVLQFAEKNRGMTRVIVGEALLLEHERLGVRMNQCLDRLESLLRQSYRTLAESRGSVHPTVEAQAAASLAICFVLGRLQRFTRTGFRRLPTEHLHQVMPALLLLSA